MRSVFLAAVAVPRSPVFPASARAAPALRPRAPWIPSGGGVRAGRPDPGALLATMLVVMLALAHAACGGSGGGGASGSGGGGAVSLEALLPDAGDVRGGNEVSVVGAGFLGAAPPLWLRFGGRVVEATPLDDRLLRASVPPGDALGVVDVQLLTGSGEARLEGGYRYLAPPPEPARLTCTPAVGLAGTRIDLVLTGFPALVAPEVRFGGLPAAPVEVLDPTRLRVAVPAGLPAGASVEVEVLEGTARVLGGGFWSQGALVAGDVTINEFLADPGSALDANRDGTASSGGDEYVELVNRLGVALDLSGWSLGDASAPRHVFPNPTTLPPGGALVVFGGGTPIFFAPPHASGHAQSATTGTLGLNNSSDSIILRTPPGVVLAQVNYVSADVTVAVSRNAVSDGAALPVPATSADYVLHGAVPGAVGAISPGVRADGSAFAP